MIPGNIIISSIYLGLRYNIALRKYYNDTITIQTMGSMRSNVPDTGLKDFYSFEEASKFTKKDFDNNPALYQRVQESMTKWK